MPLPGRAGAVDLYVEAASNPDMTGGWGWAPTPLGDLATAGDDPLYHLGAVESPSWTTRVGAAAGHLDV